MRASKVKIERILDKLHINLRTEVIVRILIESGWINYDEVFFQSSGSFKRGYGKDLQGSYFMDLDKNKTTALFFRVNREGIYDMLPEGLFHTQSRKSRMIDTEESVRDFKIHKEEEESARIFFLPLEQEFFRYRILIEEKENSVSNGFKDIDFLNEFSDFWRLPAIKRKDKINLLYLIPNASKVVGDLESTNSVFGSVLNEPVEIQLQESNKVEHIELPLAKTDVLGDNFVLGEIIRAENQVALIKIGPLKNENHLMEYVSGGNFKLLIDTLISFFFPVNLEYIIQIKLQEKDRKFTLSSEDNCLGRLSYSTYI